MKIPILSSYKICGPKANEAGSAHQHERTGITVGGYLCPGKQALKREDLLDEPKGKNLMNHRRVAITASVFFLLFFWVVAGVSKSHADNSEAQMDTINAKKQVSFYHTYGYKKKETWIVPMRAWAHEKAGMVRRISAKAAMEAMEKKTGMAELNQLEKDLFMSRIKDFIADSKSNETVIFQFDNDLDKKKYQINSKNKPSKTDHNGLIEGDIRLSQDIVGRLISSQNMGQQLRFQAVSKDHKGVGYVTIIPPKGLSVISDIDDTVKITQIPDGEGMVIKNTFFRHFVAALVWLKCITPLKKRRPSTMFPAACGKCTDHFMIFCSANPRLSTGQFPHEKSQDKPV
jgi:hypothetical protein